MQGVPQNMTVARRIERRLSLFVTFSRQPTFTSTILESITKKFSWSWHFQNVLFRLRAVSITGEINNFDGFQFQ